MANRYWVGGSGTWDSSSTTHWSASSGGAGGASVPVYFDPVYFDSNSGGGIVTCSGAVQADNFNSTGFTGIIINGQINFSGTSFILGTGQNNTFTLLPVLGPSQSITTNFNGSRIGTISAIVAGISNQTITLNDDMILSSGGFNIGNSANTGVVTLNLNGNNLTCTGIVRINTNTGFVFQMGSGTTTITNGGSSFTMINGTNLTITPSTSTIKFVSNSLILFQGGGKTYNNIYFNRSLSPGYIAILDSNTFNNFKADCPTAYSIYFTPSSTTTFNTIDISGSSGKLTTLAPSSTGTFTLSDSTGTNSLSYVSIQYCTASGGATWNAYIDNGCVDGGGNSGWTFYLAPTVTTQVVSGILSLLATGNGTVTLDGGKTITERGICWKTSSGPTTADSKVTSGGTTGVFTASMTGLSRNVTYYVKAYATNSIGTSYGAEVSFTTIQFTNPQNVYSSNNVYATLAAISGVLTVELSKDAGTNWQTALTQTFTGSDSLLTYGAGSTELWGSTWTRASMTDANFRVRLSHNGISQVYKTFGFATGTQILTGIEVAVEAKYATSTISIDLLEVKIYYGTSTLPIQAGSQVYASDGRKNGQGAGAGTGTLVYYDGAGNWCTTDTGATVAA